MKPILLLAAIYSLIIHQSHKNAKQMTMSVKKPITKAVSLQINSYKKKTASPNFNYFNAAGYISSNTYARQENKE
jgi:hypothetical protein